MELLETTKQMKKAALLLGALILLLPASLSAQGKTLAALELEADMAESGYQFKQSKDKKDKLITAYESLVKGLCLGSYYSTFVYEGPADDDKRCIEQIEKTLKLDPENPVAICARDGIDTESCRNAFDTQEASPIKVSYKADNKMPLFIGDPDKFKIPTGEAYKDLNDDLQGAVNKGTVERIYSELRMVRDRYERSKQPEDRVRLHAIYRNMFRNTCASYRTSLVDPKEEGKDNPASFYYEKYAKKQKKEKKLDPAWGFANPEANKKKEDKKSPIEDLLTEMGELDKARLNPNPSPTPVAIKRRRLISVECDRYTMEAERIDPYFAAPTCYRNGYFSPRCLDAIRLQRQHEKEEAAKLAKENEGKEKAVTVTSLPPEDGLDSF